MVYLGSTAPEHELVYVPTGDDLVVPETQMGRVVRSAGGVTVDEARVLGEIVGGGPP